MRWQISSKEFNGWHAVVSLLFIYLCVYLIQFAAVQTPGNRCAAAMVLLTPTNAWRIATIFWSSNVKINAENAKASLVIQLYLRCFVHEFDVLQIRNRTVLIVFLLRRM